VQSTVKRYFFLISQTSYVETSLHFNLADFPVAYQVTAIKIHKFDAGEMYVLLLN